MLTVVDRRQAVGVAGLGVQPERGPEAREGGAITAGTHVDQAQVLVHGGLPEQVAGLLGQA
ncbi:hypothetical protein ACIA8R_46860 [Nonomuraea sp. NPDC051191]|uniref:hypothetical protein n=1 Tax=Nonomuraea sp. NPDC051191 TaxID=3364372 RepID=UPI0037AF50EB